MLKYPPETKNAALRYRTAFAEMQDPPADEATQELLKKTQLVMQLGANRHADRIWTLTPKRFEQCNEPQGSQQGDAADKVARILCPDVAKFET